MNRVLWVLLILIVVAIVGYVVLRVLVERGSPMPNNLGVEEGRLAACPDKPNCVSSYAADDEHRIAPIAYEGSQEEARAALLTVLNNLSNSTIITQDNDYIHVELRSRLMRFVDDTEFYFAEPGLIQVRSAARIGQADMGANRRYVETIRETFRAGL
ncbi:MAG: DUF1499 domain-containing protein [Deinococcota bacterium]